MEAEESREAKSEKDALDNFRAAVVDAAKDAHDVKVEYVAHAHYEPEDDGIPSEFDGNAEIYVTVDGKEFAFNYDQASQTLEENDRVSEVWNELKGLERECSAFHCRTWRMDEDNQRMDVKAHEDA